ncbi:hypothetical protein RRF57_002156 [Xylaria bambusicola]|uniref:Uncharacterized protein n=1 Tax=Xylaria bambusicola TaxID=326684 RepID=A0AAN7UJV7_9PEZI
MAMNGKPPTYMTTLADPVEPGVDCSRIDNLHETDSTAYALESSLPIEKPRTGKIRGCEQYPPKLLEGLLDVLDVDLPGAYISSTRMIVALNEC